LCTNAFRLSAETGSPTVWLPGPSRRRNCRHGEDHGGTTQTSSHWPGQRIGRQIREENDPNRASHGILCRVLRFADIEVSLREKLDKFLVKIRGEIGGGFYLLGLCKQCPLVRLIVSLHTQCFDDRHSRDRRGTSRVIQVKMLYRQIANDHFFPHFMDEDIRAHCSEFHREVIRIHLDLQDLIQ